MPRVSVALKGKTISLRVALKRHRQLGVVIVPGGQNLAFEIWGRLTGERLWHAWPGPHLSDDFLDPTETAIVTYGLEEVAAGCLGEKLDEELMLRSINAVEAVLEAAAIGGVVAV